MSTQKLVQIKIERGVILSKELIIWHELDGIADVSLQMIEKVCNLVSTELNVKFKLESMNISTFRDKLQSISHTRIFPDIAFVPQDFVAMETAQLSVVDVSPRGLVSNEAWNSMQYNGVQRGIPFLQGNHAVLYYSKHLLKKVPTDLEEFCVDSQDVFPLSIDLVEPYWIFPFLNTMEAIDLSSKKVSYDNHLLIEVTDYFKDLMDSDALVLCNATDEMLEKFVDGRIASIINGEWVYNYLKRKMGDDLGVAVLPKINGKVIKGLKSTVGMVFPGDSLQTSKKDAILYFANKLISEEIQIQWETDFDRIPINLTALNQSKQTDENYKKLMKQMEFDDFMINSPGLLQFWESMRADLKEIFLERK